TRRVQTSHRRRPEPRHDVDLRTAVLTEVIDDLREPRDEPGVDALDALRDLGTALLRELLHRYGRPAGASRPHHDRQLFDGERRDGAVARDEGERLRLPSTCELHRSLHALAVLRMRGALATDTRDELGEVLVALGLATVGRIGLLRSSFVRARRFAAGLLGV